MLTWSAILPTEAIAEMLALHAASTQGEWTVSGISPGGGSHRFDLKKAGRRSWRTGEYFFHSGGVPPTDPDEAEECVQGLCCDCGPGKVKHDQEEADLRWAAHAHNKIPALCASHEAMRQERDEAREAYSRIQRYREHDMEKDERARQKILTSHAAQARRIEALEAGLRDLVDTSDYVFNGEAPEGTSNWRDFGLALNRAAALLANPPQEVPQP